MDSSLSPNQGSLTTTSETSFPTSLLECGICCIRQGCDVEGVIYFARARERLSPDQLHFATMLDAFIQSHARYLQAQQVLHMASRRFVEADTEQQTQLAALVKLLPALREEMDRMPQAHAATLPSENSWEYQERQTPQLPSMGSDFEQPSPPLPSSSKDCNILPALYFTCFGRFEVRRLGLPIPLCSSRRGQSILRYLVAQTGHHATTDVLIALLWPEDESIVAQSKLHSAIASLRRSLNHGCTCHPGGGYIVCKNGAYSLNPAVEIRTDVDEFLQCYVTGRQIGEGQIPLYEKACSLYTGPFLSEDLYADWSFLQREQLNQTYLAMCRVLTDHYLKIKRYEDATKWATAILKVNGCDEGAHRQLIQVYAAQGRRSEALQQYHRCECLLREELGVTPLPETTHIFQQLLISEPSSTDTAKMQ